MPQADSSAPAAAIEVGALPLPLQAVEQALTDQALNLLDPAAIQISFKALQGSGEAAPEELLVAAGEDLTEGDQSAVSLWGYRTAVGQPLQVEVQVI